MRAAALLTLLLCACPARPGRPPATPTPPSVAIAPPPTGRLGDAVHPTAYALSMQIDPSAPEFHGEVAIMLAITRPVASIWLNADGPVATRAVLELDGAPARPLTRLDAPKGLLGFDLGGTVPAGTATLRIAFTGTMGTEVGLFHQERQGRWYAFTDFEPIDARRAFPCFDDPRFKTPWTVTLTVPADTTATSNTTIAKRTTAGQTQTIQFHTTPPLPSYLVAFADGPFDVVDAGAGTMPMRIFVEHGESAKAAHAARWAPVFYATAEKLIGIPSPWHKVDFVAVPKFDGAMENPGMITVAQPILLQPADADPRRIRLLDLVLAHELSHLWFGDWVTLDYWNDLWLNEGFATRYSDQILRIARPGWRWMLAREPLRQSAVTADMGAKARAVEAPVITEVNLKSRFDATTYLKGGAVLDMLASWLGPAFDRGVQHYLRAHAWGTVTSADLAHALAIESGQPVEAVMRSFLDQPGIPLVTPTLRCQAGHVVMDAAQTPLQGYGTPPRDTRWTMPVCTRDSSGRACAVTTPAQPTVQLDQTCPASVVINPDGDTYAMTALDPAAVRALAAGGRATDRDWLHVIESVRARVRAGTLPPPQAMATLAPLSSLTLPGPVVSELGALLDELAVLSRDPQFADQAWAIAARSVNAIGVTPNPNQPSPADDIARPDALEIAAHFAPATAPIARDARTRLDQPVVADNNLQLELAIATASLAAAHGSRDVHDKLIRLLNGDRDTRIVAFSGLAAEQDPTLAAQSLGLALTRSPAEANYLLSRAVDNPMTRATAWQFIDQQLQTLLPQHRINLYAAVDACTDDELRVATLLLDQTLASAPAAARAARDSIQAQMKSCNQLRSHY